MYKSVSIICFNWHLSGRSEVSGQIHLRHKLKRLFNHCCAKLGESYECNYCIALIHCLLCVQYPLFLLCKFRCKVRHFFFLTLELRLKKSLSYFWINILCFVMWWEDEFEPFQHLGGKAAFGRFNCHENPFGKQQWDPMQQCCLNASEALLFSFTCHSRISSSAQVLPL